MATASGAFETSVYNMPTSDAGYYSNRLRIEWSSEQSVANNTSTIYWSVYSAGGTGGTYGGRYVLARKVSVYIADNKVLDLQSDFKMYHEQLLGSGSFTLTHNTDGTKSFSAYAEAAIYTYAISTTGSYSVDLPTIPRASSVSISGNTIGSTMWINILRASSSFTHTITWQFGSRSGTCATQTSNTSISWTPGLELADQIPNSTYGSGTIRCITYSGSTYVGERTVSFMLYLPSNIGPSITWFSPGLYYTNLSGCSLYIKNQSAVKWSLGVSTAYGATIKKCTITGQNLSYEVQYNATSYTGVSNTLTSAGGHTYTATIVDSRGRSASTSGTIYVNDYDTPRITSATSFRSDAYGNLNGSGSYVTHKVTASFYSLNNSNNVAINVAYKASSSSTYGNTVYIKNDNSSQTTYTYTHSSNSFAPDTAYDFLITISDSLGRASSVFTHVGTKNIPLNISKDNKSVAIGGFAQNAGSSTGRFDCAWDAYFTSAPIVSSDRKLKCNINDIDINIIDSLHPVKYNLVDGDPDIIHYGFVAQDVEKVLQEAGVQEKKTGMLRYDEDETTNERSNYALAYDEIIPLLVKKCQELQQEINELKGK